MHLFGALAEFERSLMRERTIAGLAAARKRGRVGGRPRLLTGARLKQARQWREEGKPVWEIAILLGVGRTTVYEALKGGAGVGQAS